MSKKLFIGLAPLLVTAAFVITPAAAQATPHWYVNGNSSPLTEGTAGAIPAISWGNLALEWASGIIVKCQNVLLNEDKNPVGGGPGEGVTYRFATFNCTTGGTSTCEPTSGVEFEEVGEHMPWPEVLRANGATVDLETTGIELISACVVVGAYAPVASPTGNDSMVERVVAPSGGPFPCNGTGTPGTHDGTSIAKLKRGSGVGSEGPSKVEFQPGLNTSLNCGAIGTRLTVGKLKTMGYNANELIEAH
jgi:hypothetical protein